MRMLESSRLDTPSHCSICIKSFKLILYFCLPITEAVGPLSSATYVPIFMQLTGQNNDGTASSAFLLARKGN